MTDTSFPGWHGTTIIGVKKGDEVVTQGGLIGKVTKVKGEGRLEVEIASGVKAQVVQATIAQVLNKTETKK